MKVTLLTLGCKVNQSESNRIESDLLSTGHEIVSLKEKPDICIVNTCTVTSKSDYQSRQYIRRALKTGGRVVVTGCYSELNGHEIHAISSDVTVVPNSNKSDIINKIFQKNRVQVPFIGHGKSRHFVKIQDGCNKRCTYCAIQMARGRSVSIPVETIVEEIKLAHSSGINEIVLTGIHIGFYGNDLDREISLDSLVAEILKSTSIPRIRLSSLEVGEISERTIDLLSDQRLCDHLHIPLQSGNDQILRRMGRGYTQHEFNQKIDKIIRKHPLIALGTDVIVGFPGEDNDAYRITLDFIQKSPFTYLHVFPYSKRKGTPASIYKEQVPSIEKDERVSQLNEISDIKKASYAKQFVGHTLDMIIEKQNAVSTYSATTGNYLKAVVKSTSLKKGSLVFSRIEKASKGLLYTNPIKLH
ncbi:MAG: tRNA (N(6)-L-threonylcarbamoyladenosine(37)-C(2))-methylthiotransferase MtaB [Thermoplasmata archaeon M9B2D]|nr:MAG: tRNA (N(6)-L-threonylcarbamoyladenosine(37)-C(2))-methylthiotransferase MtaB [Thermoplasmata archaeon M9B2D]